MRDPLTMLNRIGDTGRIDEEAANWLASSLRCWWLAGSDPARLPYHLHLAVGSRSLVQKRDRWLRLAGDELPEQNRAAALKRRIDTFMRHVWPLWRGESTPPECEAVDAALFYAADSGACMMITRRQLNNILSGK